MPYLDPSDSLPILTETVDGTTIDLPILKETVDKSLNIAALAMQISNAQYHQIAERLLPQVEAILLEAISTSPEADWESAIHQVRSHLPALIRKVIQELR